MKSIKQIIPFVITVIVVLIIGWIDPSAPNHGRKQTTVEAKR